MADALRLAFTYLLRPNCGAISRAISTSRTCEVSTCFIVDSRRTLDGTLHSCQPMISLVVNSCDLRGRMPQARSSWIAPLTYCSWRAADVRQRHGLCHRADLPGLLKSVIRLTSGRTPGREHAWWGRRAMAGRLDARPTRSELSNKPDFH
jgi:hypothetical protein